MVACSSLIKDTYEHEYEISSQICCMLFPMLIMVDLFCSIIYLETVMGKTNHTTLKHMFFLVVFCNLNIYFTVYVLSNQNTPKTIFIILYMHDYYQT